MNLNHRFYKKWTKFFAMFYKMGFEYFGRRLALLGSVSYILVGIKVIAKSAGLRNLIQVLVWNSDKSK